MVTETTEMCLLSNDIHDYHYVSQGKTEIPGVDDAAEFKDCDVSCPYPVFVKIWTSNEN